MADEKKEKPEDPFAKRAFYVFVGSIPITLVLLLCVNLIYLDYAKNNYSFFDKSIFVSNIDSYVFETRVTCLAADAAASKYTESSYKGSGSGSGNLGAKYKKCYSSEVRHDAAHFCFRYFNDFLVDGTEADRLISLSKKAFSYSTSSDRGITTFDIFSGQLVNNDRSSINLKKYLENGNIFSSDEINTFLDVKERVLKHIKSHFGIDNLYLTKPVLFTRFRSGSDDLNTNHADFEYWKDQIDEMNSRAAAYTGIVQLNTYVKEFFGGRFNFRNVGNRTILSIQPKKGRVLVYTTGNENEYYIERMQSGDFFQLRFSFTCDQAFEVVSSGQDNRDFLQGVHDKTKS